MVKAMPMGTPATTVALCAIAKDEGDYLGEWLDYHFSLGVSHIYLYDNHDVPQYGSWAGVYPGRLTVFHLPGACAQMTAYEHGRRVALAEAEPPVWLGFIDIDEFIVLRTKGSIPEFLDQYGPAEGALALNWVLFGNNGHEGYDPTGPEGTSVLRRFTRRQVGVNPHIKWLVRLTDLKMMLSPHHGLFHRPSVNAVDCEGRGVPDNGPYHPEGTDTVACIHHYFTKSTEEFRRKCLRGRADIPVRRTMAADFARHNCNEIEDRTIAGEKGI